jgi:hypothetical protein
MRYSGEIFGIVNDHREKTTKSTKIFIDYTSDKIGKTLSLGSSSDGYQITIPFDRLYEIITGGKN